MCFILKINYMYSGCNYIILIDLISIYVIMRQKWSKRILWLIVILRSGNYNAVHDTACVHVHVHACIIIYHCCIYRSHQTVVT